MLLSRRLWRLYRFYNRLVYLDIFIRVSIKFIRTKIGILFRISYFLENLMTSDLFFLSAATGKGSRGDGDSGKKRIFAPEIIHRKNIRQR